MTGELKSATNAQDLTVPEIAVRISDTLDAIDLETAIELADAYAPVVGRDPALLMSEGARLLIQSGDPLKEGHGLDWIERQAVDSPDPTKGDSLAYQVLFDVDDEARQPNFRRRFEISLTHFRQAALAEGFVPTPKFLERFNGTVNRIKKLGFDDLFSEAVREFTSLILEANRLYIPQQPKVRRDENRVILDESLLLIGSLQD
ncbi:MAG: hypothetical protein ACHQT9_00550 [Candidatus Saccharimonadales bacterium]